LAIGSTGLRSLLVATSVLFGLLLPGPAARAEAESGRPGVLHRIVLYAPNRVLDVLDLVRLRARVGPGFAVGLRATELADVYLGSYAALYLGLPGPRGRRVPKLPVGFENHHGVEVGVVDASSGFAFGPGYTATEFGVGFQAAILGLDLGIDPFEIVDLAAGLLLFDPRGDDL
jgi:hypothetical protein